MNNIRKGLALALVLIFLFPLVALQSNNVKAASDSGLPGWMNFGADLNNTFSYNVPSQWAGSPSVPFTSLWSQSSQASFVLTGDLIGTGQLEVAVSSSPNLNVYDAGGNLVWTVNPVKDSSPTGAVLGGITLANMNGTMVVLATVSSGSQNSNGALAILIYSGKGNLLKEIQGPNAWAFDQVRLADLNGNGNYEVIATVYSGYTLSPRGVYAYSYDTGLLLWTYQMGPTPHLDALADLTHSGKLNIVISSFAPCNGYSQGTTNDFSIYEIALTPDGQVLWNTCLGTGGQQSVRSAIADFEGNGDLKVVAFVRSDPVVDPKGPNNIYLLNGATGNIEDTHVGIVGDSWHGFSISTALSGNTIIFADTESGKIYAFDSKLNVISQTNIGGTPVPLIYGHINGEENNDGSTLTSANLYSGGNIQVAILVNRPDGTQQVSVFDASSIGGNSSLVPLWSQILPLTTSNSYYTMVLVSNLGNGVNDIILTGSPGLLVFGPSNANGVPASTPTPTASPNVGTPVISSVTPILATRLQSIDIHGSGFGKTQPQLTDLGDGSVDTVGGGTTPVIRIYDEGNSNSWEAGVQDTSNTGADSIGLILVSWSYNDIVLGGFGTALSTNGTGQWNLSPGDPLLLSVLTNDGQAVYTAVAGSTQSNQNPPVPAGAPPIISSVSQIAAVRLQTIVIYGSGFGSISPQLMNLSDGSQDTVIGGTSPVLRIYDEAGVDSWEAGCTDSQWVPKDSVGIYLVSWSDSQIILGGFGTELNANGQGPVSINPEDPLIVDVVTFNGQAAYTTTAVSNQSNQNPSVSNLPTPTLTVSCQSSTTNTNFQVEILGTLNVQGQGVPFVPILLSYSVNGGNSWNDLTLVNTDSDGNFLAIWNPSVTGNYLLTAEWSGNNQYPQMNTTVSFSVAPFEKDTVFSVLSNSTLSGISFNSTNKELSFTVSGPSGTTGYVDVYIAKSSINDVSNLIVHLDGNQIAYTSKSIGDSWLISFSYHHSTHQITMNLSATSSITIKEILLAIATGVIIAVLVTVAFSLILRERTKKTCD